MLFVALSNSGNGSERNTSQAFDYHHFEPTNSPAKWHICLLSFLFRFMMVLLIAFVFLFHSFIFFLNLDIPLALTLESTFPKPKGVNGSLWIYVAAGES